MALKFESDNFYNVINKNEVIMNKTKVVGPGSIPTTVFISTTGLSKTISDVMKY
jgi:hypothetical protein